MVIKNIFAFRKDCKEHTRVIASEVQIKILASVLQQSDLLYGLSTNSIRILLLLAKKKKKKQDSAVAIISFYIKKQFLHSSPVCKLIPRICIIHKKHIKVLQNLFTDDTTSNYVPLPPFLMDIYFLSKKLWTTHPQD